MEYTVGSVADLISGKNTPNKVKVIKKNLPQSKVDANKEPKNNNDDPPFSRSNKAPFEKGNKKQYLEKPSFDKVNKKSFKKGNKPPFNKNNKKVLNPSNNSESNVTVINHELIEKMEKGELDLSSSDSDESDDDTIEDVNQKEISATLKKDQDSRTIFVGNIATTVTKSQLLKVFKKFGQVEAVRLRCATPNAPGVSKRVAVIKKMFHPKRTTMHSYIRFQNREDALKALKLNGTKYKEHHLRVQMCDDLEKPDTSKAIFVGNLPFDVEDDDLWTAFEMLGDIKSVRVIRNSNTGMGIGIGYVNFDSSDSVEFALQMEDVTVKKKVIRIQRCKENSKKPRKMRRQKRKHLNKSGGQDNSTESLEKPVKESKKLKGTSKKTEDVEKPKRVKKAFKDNKAASVNIKNGVFQGSKSDKKKQKPKANKGFIQKLKLSQKIAPRTTL